MPFSAHAVPSHGVIAAACVLLSAFLMAGCAAAPPAALAQAVPTADLTQTAVFALALEQAARALPTATHTATSTPIPPTPTATSTPLRTPPALPTVFTSSILAKNVIPQTYVGDTCTYLKARWDPNNSAPGTVVMTIMYHSITKDYNPLFADGSQVHHSELVQTLQHAHEVGFHTITTAQLAEFLDHNAKIPPRSLLIIVDDRKRKEFYETHFIPFLKDYGWTITNAWISAKDTPDYLWKENLDVINAGWVDPQAHGVVHNIPIGEYSNDAYINNELKGSISAIQEHFGKTPIGFIWPGGGFTQHAAVLARAAGYDVGFTTNPRGPVMYNWVPLAEKSDPNHPNWLPEIPVGDPRMVLPRYWSLDAAYRIDDVIAVGDQAIQAAKKSQADELTYYDVLCKSKTGPIPTLQP